VTEASSRKNSNTLWQRARSLPFSEVLPFWDDFDSRGTDVEAIRELCLNDRYYLLVKMLRRYDLWHPWIYARCREVEASPDGYVDIWFREAGKSSIITFGGIIQEILNDPEITVGIFSHVKPIAKAFLAQIQREFESNLNLIHTFPDILYQNPQKQARSWSLDGGIIVKRQGNPKEATVEAHGLVDGQPTSRHFQLLVYDDVVTKESVNTPEQIAKTTEAWELSDNLGTAGGRKWIIGTRYHYADTYASIIERGAAKPRIYPATDDGLITGNPVLFSQAEWDRRVRDQGEATVSCQLLCNPLAGHQRMFDINDLVEYEVRPETLMVYLLIDPARSKKKDSAHTAMIVLGLSVGGAKFLLDGFDHKMDLTERWTNMRDLWETWTRMPGVQGVKVGYEEFGAQADLDYFKERMREERVQFDIEELAWPRDGEGAKNDRVQRLTPDLRNHRFYVPYETDPENLTSAQRKMVQSGYEYRNARSIKRLDENRQMYDLTERLRLQIGFFPFCERKDVVDALSRIYDLEPTRPERPADPQDLEPDVL
jgi:hypothetical protein